MPIINVPHLNGASVGYQSSTTDPSKPTLVLIVPFTTTVDYYDIEFSNRELSDRVNLIAVEPLGHGSTRTKTENFTYWDSAIIFLQLLDALGVKKTFVLGTSQGGWMGIRMELLAPEKVSYCTPYPMPHPFPLRAVPNKPRSKVLFSSEHLWTTSPLEAVNWAVGMVPRLPLVWSS